MFLKSKSSDRMHGHASERMILRVQTTEPAPATARSISKAINVIPIVIPLSTKVRGMLISKDFII